jgi:hypothetical protein
VNNLKPTQVSLPEGLQARGKNVVCRSGKTVNGQNAVRNLIAGTQQFYRPTQSPTKR